MSVYREPCREATEADRSEPVLPPVPTMVEQMIDARAIARRHRGTPTCYRMYTEDDAVSFAVDYGDGLGALFRRVTVCRPCLDVLDARPKTREGGA